MGVDPKRLEELVDENAFDELFELVSPEDTARAWCSYQLREHPKDEEAGDDPDWWAIELMFNLEDSGEEPRLRKLLTLIIECAQSDAVLGVAGAGPLGDFVKGGDARVPWVEAQAASSETFRKALANVWVRGYVSEENFARLERAAGVSLR